MNKFKDLKVWQKSVDVAVKVYEATNDFPDSGKFGLTSQIRRSAISISSNIAEGAGRNSSKEFKQFLSYAYGSTCELETQLIISKELTLLPMQVFQNLNNLIIEIQKMLYALKDSLKVNTQLTLSVLNTNNKKLATWMHIL